MSGTVAILLSHLGLRDAADVLVTGCSAGGLAALLHAEGIRDAMRAAGATPRRFKVCTRQCMHRMRHAHP